MSSISLLEINMLNFLCLSGSIWVDDLSPENCECLTVYIFRIASDYHLYFCGDHGDSFFIII